MNTENTSCKHCGRLISSSDKVCPYCHKSQRKSLLDISVYFLWGVVALGIIGLLFFNVSIGENRIPLESTDNSTQYLKEFPSDDTSQVPETINDLKIGQTFSSEGIDVTLNSVSEWEGDDFFEPEDDMVYLLVNVTIRNNSTGEYSSFDTNFTGYADGEYVDRDFVGDDDLSADVLIPGAFETGDVDFEVPKNWNTFQLRLENGYNSKTTGTFIITRNEITPTDRHQHKDHDTDDFDYFDEFWND